MDDRGLRADREDDRRPDDETRLEELNTPEAIMGLMGVDEVTAREILAIESGESDGDVVTVTDGAD
jgi:hypothetical protein